MTPPPTSDAEAGRVKALRQYELLDTLPEGSLDELTALAAAICGTPISLISLIDENRQWFKSRFGWDVKETPRAISFCAHTICQRKVLIVSDALKDERFADNPLVTGPPGIRFYAGAPLLTPEGHTLGTICVIDRVPRELTELQEQALGVLSRQVMAQLDLRRQTREVAARERLLQGIFDSEPECVKLVGPDGSLRMMNRAGLQMIQADSFEQVADLCLYPLIVPEHRARFQDLTERVFRGESGSLEFQITGLQGARRWLETNATPLRAESGEVTVLLGVTRDVTERRRAEETLRESEDRYRLLVEESPDAIGIYQDHKLVFINTTGVKQFGAKSADELLGRSSDQVIHPEDRQAAADRLARRLAGETGMYPALVRYVRLDGKVLPVEVSATHVNFNGKPAVQFIARDISARQTLEEQLRQSQKLEAIGQLAGGVAHDFNNILAAMMMQAELASEAENLPPEVAELLDDLKASAERAASLTRQLLAFSRRQVMQPSLVDLNEIVTSLTKMLQRILGEDVSLQLNLHAHPLLTDADASMLDQVLLNLVVNSRDAMPTGGRLTIETIEKNLTELEAHQIPEITPGRHVVLRVTDTGCGIPSENLLRIFEPFFTTKEPGKGTGLGLATVFGIVKQHGGAIQVRSKVGHGTTVNIFLRATQATDTSSIREAAKSEARGGTETILVVEDERAVRVLTRVILERHGYQVLEAASGVEALRVWEQNPGTIHLLLTDMVMPDGIGGRELAARLRALSPHLRVIYTSGYSAETAGRELTLLPGQYFVQKPSPPHKLLEIVRRCLDH